MSEPVWWQIVLFVPYSYWCDAAEAVLPNALNAATMPSAETISASAKTLLADQT
ncbi:MAG: hypothetical protein M3540_10180 [Actinomycetota bacterium]|nr:hypothetical protein [Actinomycetota bacterium]